jgi:protein-disulfide isomerase
MSKKQAVRQRAKGRAETSKGRKKSWLPFALIGGVLLLAIVGGLWFMRSVPQTGSVAAGSSGANPPQAKGRDGAPVTIEEFGDYQCPPCGALYPELEKIMADYGDRVRLVFRHYPLVRIHPNALAAAHAAEAAGLQGKFWEMHDQLYRGQKSWERAGDVRGAFAAYARSLGLDAERFSRDMSGEAVDTRVTADLERARSLGVDSTPVIFVNGRQLPFSSQTGKDLRAAIDQALGGKR